jgi:hypothetical protein
MSAATLEHNVQYILDRFEIQDVLARYAAGQDDHQGEQGGTVEDWSKVLHPMLSLTTPRPGLLSRRSALIGSSPKLCAEPQSVPGL